MFLVIFFRIVYAAIAADISKIRMKNNSKAYYKGISLKCAENIFKGNLTRLIRQVLLRIAPTQPKVATKKIMMPMATRRAAGLK